MRVPLEVKVTSYLQVRERGSEAMVTIVIDEAYCKGCCLCIHYCPKKVLERSSRINPKGYAVPYAVTPERCTKCKICELLCPEFAVTVEENGA